MTFVPEKYSKTNLRLSLPKTHHLFVVATEMRLTQLAIKKEDPHPW